MNTFIPVYQPTIVGNESLYVNECLTSGWISSRGDFVNRFEQSFAKYINANYATTVCNGTVGLHLALVALGIKPGDEVIVPTFTYIASVNAISYVGAKPVFVDSEPGTWNIDVSDIESRISEKTKAIMAVHIYGAVCDMVALKEICSRHGLFLIEDVAEAFGSQYQNQFAGTFGDVAVFSFFGNKTITTGEGGMIVSKSASLNNRIAYLKSQAVSLTKEYWHDEVGFNYRMTNICAAIGLAQLEGAEFIIQKKREILSWYKEQLSALPLIFQVEQPGTKHTYWMVSILTDSDQRKNHIRQKLKQVGVETRPFFYPAHIMPVFKSNSSFPVVEGFYDRGINLPSFHGLTHEQVTYICDHIRKNY